MIKPGAFTFASSIITTEHDAKLTPYESISVSEWLKTTHRSRIMSKCKKFVLYTVVLKDPYDNCNQLIRMLAIDNPIGLPHNDKTFVQKYKVSGIVMDEGENRYYVNDDGLIHREDGPAIVFGPGRENMFGETKLYYLNGNMLSLEKYWNFIKNTENAGRVFSEVFGNE